MVIRMAKLRMAHASRLGQKKEEEEELRLNDGDNNGQAMHGARMHEWRKQATWAKILILHLKVYYKSAGPKITANFLFSRLGLMH